MILGIIVAEDVFIAFYLALLQPIIFDAAPTVPRPSDSELLGKSR